MLQGWISVHRQIQEHWLWADKPFSKGQAWIDMLMLANHEDKKTLIDNNIVVIESGSFVTSEHKLAERWGWSRWKVNAFLALLQSDNMIFAKTDHRKTTINVINYEKYRYAPSNHQPVTNQLPTTDRPLTDTNNNDNNANNTLSYPLFCARTRESFSEIDVGVIGAKLMRKGVFVSGEEIEKMLKEVGKAETLKFYGLE